MHRLMVPVAALALLVSGAAQAQDNGRHRGEERGHDRGQQTNAADVEASRQRVQSERQDVREAQRYGTRGDVRAQQFDVEQARRQYEADNRDWRNNQNRARQEQRQSASNWQRGRSYSWNRPDPRYNGYYADNYYRSGSYYRPRQLQPGERIYRGRDNRYYCRRNDGTTGLIIGAIGGGVLGNAIAPGGSQTLGAILGGSLGAILGNSIGSGGVTCR